MSRNTVAGLLAGIGLFFGAALAAGTATADEAANTVKVYKSPTCGCCAAWVDHLIDNGFVVQVVEKTDVEPFKRHFRVPPQLYSCHTAEIDGYVVEGHVPAADIRRMLAERPAIRGLAVPGMPEGSPGMETGRVDPYSVVSFDDNNQLGEYARY